MKRESNRWVVKAAWLSVGLVGALLGSYGQRSADADAPPGRYTIQTDTVVDEVTGLMWERVADTTLMTQEAAVTHCAALSLASEGDWRLPTVRELQSLVDDTRANPAIDVAAFPATSSEPFWTSTLEVEFSNTPYYVSFGNGSSGYLGAPASARARCVR